VGVSDRNLSTGKATTMRGAKRGNLAKIFEVLLSYVLLCAISVPLYVYPGSFVYVLFMSVPGVNA